MSSFWKLHFSVFAKWMNFVVLEINSREISTILHRSSLSNAMKRRKIFYWVFCNTSDLIEKVSLVTFNLVIELIYQWGQPMLKDLRFLMISILIFAPTVFQAVFLWVKTAPPLTYIYTYRFSGGVFMSKRSLYFSKFVQYTDSL